MIEHLRDVLLRGTDDNAVALPTLLRLVRERDGTLDNLTADFERRANGTGSEAASATLVLGHIQRQNVRLDEAIARYRRAAELAPTSPAPVLALAETERQMEHNADALASYERALALGVAADRQGDVLRAMLDLALATGDVPRARAYHQRLMARSGASLSVRRELGDALMTRRMFSDAATEFDAVARALSGDNRVLPPVLRDLARAQMQADRLDDALATLRRALRIAGADSGARRELYDDMTELRTRRHELDAWVHELESDGGATAERMMLLGRLHAEQGRFDQAISAYRRAIALRPADVDAHVQLVQLLSQGGRLDEVIAARRRLVEVAPRNPAYVTDLADELVRGGRRAEALDLLARASARAGDDADLHERLAQVYARMGEQRLALRETELVARYDPSDPAALESLGERLMEQGDQTRAVATWQRIRESARDRARGAAALAEVYGRHDMTAQAMELYREAIALRPDELDFHKGLAVLEEAARQFEPAIASWRRVIELSRDDRDLRREARARIVNLWSLEGRLATEVPALERAFNDTPPDLEAGRDLAEVYTRLRRFEDADRTLARLSTAAPGDVATLAALERLRVQRGDLAGAIDALRRLVEADPRRAREGYQRLASHALALHRDAEAIEAAAHAVELSPDDASGHLRLGELYLARNDAAQAAAAFRRAISLNDRLFPTYFVLAELYLARDEAREAVELYRRVIRLCPDDEFVTRAGRMAIQVAPAADAVADLERDLSTAAVTSPGRVALRRLLVDLYAATCRPLIHIARHGAPAAATQARARLAGLGGRALKPLLDALSDPDLARQRISLEILGYLGNPNATTGLLGLAEGSAAREVRLGALRAAATLADPRALTRLVALSRSDDAAFATLSAWGIGRIHTPAATAALVQIATRRERSDASAMATLMLSGARAPTARAALLHALDAPPGSAQSGAAMLALASSADASTVRRLRSLLVGTEPVRAVALAALGAAPSREPAVLDDLAAGLFSPMNVRLAGADTTVRRVAARALVRVTDGDDAAYRSALEDPDAATSTTTMIGRLLDPPGAALDGSRALVAHSGVIARAAREALTTPQGIERVLDALSTPGRISPLTSEVATPTPEAVAAARAVVRAVTPALAALASHPDVGVRRRALAVLATSDAPEAAEALSRAADDPDATVAEEALTLLASREGEGAATLSASTAQHLDAANPWKTRLAAAAALGRSSSPDGVEALVRALSGDPLSIVRGAAARALSRRAADPAVRAALERASRDDIDASVRSAAERALR